ncbi:MAG: 3'-5' exonuclease [Bacteroidetes bacterium]|jgi:DNA polymerase-3 subunit epsilon|nr:3'-5' exonuclease [Bacteroidota bacterium]MBX7128918.1 3'-5' exonuclease [Flavobacteriales bacterium]MCC6654062.1 3'-5' exonuclease [Flavobacteriales bacterium]HMU15358.1 3'-5' exonuclease [Flavobacteriales bacterium]HNE79189.1 3'-5' exonuclease [Flavobacteriales bacterium]
MPPSEFVVIDVETTNGDPLHAGIIEVAVIVHDDLQEVERWNTLVRSTRTISPFVERLTGIRSGMLVTAPTFADVAPRLGASVKDRIMVAHNVRYDMTALQQEFARTGTHFGPDTLCTERLARRLIPGLTHYNLGNLCRHLGISRGHEHRAAHDAQATLNLLLRLIQDHGSARILEAVVPGQAMMRA